MALLKGNNAMRLAMLRTSNSQKSFKSTLRHVPIGTEAMSQFVHPLSHHANHTWLPSAFFLIIVSVGAIFIILGSKS
eukprot:5586956-Amphidinium_carterae.1